MRKDREINGVRHQLCGAPEGPFRQVVLAPFKSARNPSARNPSARNRRGLSLLEVVMAVAIMGMAMAVIGNLVYLGSRSASNTKWLSQAQMLCDTKMAEVSSGILELESVSDGPIDEKPNWTYTVQVQSSDLPGLLRVTVSVQPAGQYSGDFEAFELTRLLPDPDYEPEQPMVQQ